MKKLLIANFKQNKTKAQIEDYFLNNNFNTNINCEVVVCPSFVHIDLVKQLGVDIEIAGQAVSPFSKGSYTGAVGAFQLQELGVKYCIVGHSERRKYFAESSQVINNQIKELEAVGIIPIVCFSNLDEIRRLEIETKKHYLAYEPLDSINTNGMQSNADDNEDIEVMFSKVREVREDSLLIYGGSVDKDNILRLCEVDEISGFLVGTASLEKSNFIEIYKKVK